MSNNKQRSRYNSQRPEAPKVDLVDEDIQEETDITESDESTWPLPLPTSEDTIQKAFLLIAGKLDTNTISEKELSEIKDIRMKILKGESYR